MPELLLTPAPVIENNVLALAVIVKALAPALNTIPLTSVTADTKGLVAFEVPNVAVSNGPLGTVIGLQLLAVFQSPVGRLSFHVALPAWAAGMKRR